ncbi:MAG TPA: DUF3631 domain-containing protein [Candidatus Acidoferrum sp.]|nr:DUF3631 domain-containing protein [Candidatus Acidoferrum sp.]
MTAQKQKKGRRSAPSSNAIPELPRSTEAERVVVGALLVGISNREGVLTKLKAEDFFDQQLRSVYSRVRAMQDEGKTVDLPTVVDELRAYGELERAGGPAFVASLVDGMPHRLALDSYVSAMVETALLRRIAYVRHEITEAALKSTAPREVLLGAENKFATLRAALPLRARFCGTESGSQILDKTADFLRRFIVMSPAQAYVLAIWIVHTHSLDAADVTGYLSITLAEKRSGKTRLLEVLELLVAEPWLTGRVTAAVLVRKIDAVRPTLLLDESDTALRDDSEYGDVLRGVLNLGYRRGGVVSCCVGAAEKLDFHDFSVFGAKAIAGIGSLPDTVADRSFSIRLQGRAPDELVESFRRSEIVPEAVGLRDQIAGWASKIVETLKASKPEPLAELGDRQNEIAASLLAIADAAGGDWPQRARTALLEIFRDCTVRDESLRVRLLADIRVVFDEGGSQHISTPVLLEHLNANDNAPWCESTHGKPLTARGLARMLAPFEIRPEHFREGARTIRGYTRASFRDAWERYCSSSSVAPGTNDTSGTANLLNELAVPDKNAVPASSDTDELSGTAILLKTKRVPDVPPPGRAAEGEL